MWKLIVTNLAAVVFLIAAIGCKAGGAKRSASSPGNAAEGDPVLPEAIYVDSRLLIDSTTSYDPVSRNPFGVS